MSHKNSQATTGGTPPATQATVEPPANTGTPSVDTPNNGTVLPPVKTANTNVPPASPVAPNLPAANVLGDPTHKKPNPRSTDSPPDPFATQSGAHPATTAPDKTGPDKTTAPVKPPATTAGKLLVPDEKALAAADAELAIALPNPMVADLMQQAQQASAGPAIYAALRKARELAVSNADVAGASGAVEQICRRITVDE